MRWPLRMKNRDTLGRSSGSRERTDRGSSVIPTAGCAGVYGLHEPHSDTAMTTMLITMSAADGTSLCKSHMSDFPASTQGAERLAVTRDCKVRGASPPSLEREAVPSRHTASIKLAVLLSDPPEFRGFRL